jgi:hypothetical protein
MENWNSANKDIFYGKAGDLTGDDREHVEVSALALHLIQATIAYLNTHLIQIILREDPKVLPDPVGGRAGSIALVHRRNRPLVRPRPCRPRPPAGPLRRRRHSSPDHP